MNQGCGNRLEQRTKNRRTKHIEYVQLADDPSYKIESHYLRAQTTREFISSDKSLADIYRDYKRLRERDELPVATSSTFNRIFNTEFNISFFVPKKDQCDLCERFKNSDEKEKRKLIQEYEEHLKEKTLARTEKENDKNRKDGTVVAVYDLQAVLQIPKGQISLFFYKSRINCLNFTISDLRAKDVICYFWDETEGKRGAVEIGSCILDYIKSQVDQNPNKEIDVIFYSDNCGGQQKNKFLLSAYAYAVNKLTVKSITHKFLIRGHSQNEGDNVHSVIEKQIKRYLQSGPIYIPEQYKTLIVTAKKTGKPYKVVEMTHSKFYDMKALQESWGSNFNIDEEKNQIKWHDIKVLRVEKEHPEAFFYKTSFTEETYRKACVRKRVLRRRGTGAESVEWWQTNLRSLKRLRRDVRETTKYIETALVIDKAMFDRRNGSTRSEVVHDAIQVANIADLYFRTLNTRVSLVYIESWQSADQADIDRKQDITRAIQKFSDYSARKLFKIEKDTTQLLSGLTFPGGESGISVPDTMCTPKSVGISVDTNTYEPHLLAGTMAHMIGHNIGMGHDDGRESCCKDWHGCIMAQSIVGLENVQPYKFSDCSKNDYINELRIGQGLCLLNKPNELVVHRQCGNGRLDEGEECDCGTIAECQNLNPCCDPFTCRLTKEAQCAEGECCERCQLKPRGIVCRESRNECDLEETCTGLSGSCPVDSYRKNGEPCESSKGYCFAGQCPTLSNQCETIWGTGSNGADKECFDQFNTKGSVTGHCGKDNTGNFMKCDTENVRCGSLQCQSGNRFPVVPGMDEYYTRTVITIKGKEYDCKATTGLPEHSEIGRLGLVRDGTPCGDNLICVNQTCTSIFPYIDHTRCPTDHNNNECSARGDIDNSVLVTKISSQTLLW
ncbi:unnamed protein product [Euphydryas editha]|uniref:Uncharacterized protein n=1 Tax=Euphydryas editha TaxID=104508 RepID=A0AAU9TII1_EUPED|nr:unnamed protein product [Euphydryas editha]